MKSLQITLQIAVLFIIQLSIGFYESIAQNVGIGTSTPLDKLHVIGNIRSSTLAGVGARLVLSDLNGTLINASGANFPSWQITGNSNIVNNTNFLGTTNNIDLRFRTNNIERMTIKNDGSIGLFTNAPVASWLHSIPQSLANDFQFKWDNNLSADAPARFQNSQTANGSRVFLGVTNYNGNALAANGVMGLAINAAGTGASGVEAFSNSGTGTGLLAGYIGGPGWAGFFNGDVGCTGLYFGSDRKLKRDINPINNALNIINQVDPISYYYDTETYPDVGFDENRLTYGFIAQDIEKILPELVKEKILHINGTNPRTDEMIAERKTESVKVVNYSLLIPVLTQAIKEQQATIENLENRIKSLENNQ